MRIRIAIATAAALQASACVCTEPKDPCLTWLVDGETYKVELVKHYEGVDKNAFQPATPYNRYQYPELTCGVGLDLREGSILIDPLIFRAEL
jgi:hypothetical protein